jgi:hypothetical protein
VAAVVVVLVTVKVAQQITLRTAEALQVPTAAMVEQVVLLVEQTTLEKMVMQVVSQVAAAEAAVVVVLSTLLAQVRVETLERVVQGKYDSTAARNTASLFALLCKAKLSPQVN